MNSLSVFSLIIKTLLSLRYWSKIMFKLETEMKNYEYLVEKELYRIFNCENKKNAVYRSKNYEIKNITTKTSLDSVCYSFHTCIHRTYIYTRIHKHTCILVYTNIHAYICTNIHIYIHNAHLHISYIHTYLQTYKYIICIF